MTRRFVADVIPAGRGWWRVRVVEVPDRGAATDAVIPPRYRDAGPVRPWAWWARRHAARVVTRARRITS